MKILRTQVLDPILRFLYTKKCISFNPGDIKYWVGMQQGQSYVMGEKMPL